MKEYCPYCITFIPDGATVCRGCGAEKEISKTTTVTYSGTEALGLSIVVWLILSVLIYAITLFSIDFSTALFIAAAPAIIYGIFMSGHKEQQHKYAWVRYK